MTPLPSEADHALALDAEWLAALGIGSLLPRSLSQWEPLVLEGLARFLNALPAARIEALVQAQFQLGLDAPLPARITTLLLQCPTLHKLGQVLARQKHLPQELRDQLRQLESTPARTDAPVVATLVHNLRALVAGSATPAPGLQIDAAPLAEGSVALVLPFRWQDADGEQQGVFKVLRPGVARQLDEELSTLPAIAQFLQQRGAELQLPALDYAGTLDSVARLLREEIQLEREQTHLQAAHAFYSRTPAIHIPRLLPWSTSWVTAMERIHGQPLAEAGLPPPERQRLARIAIDALLAQPFWSPADPSLFHGDLHGGNLMLTEQGRLAVLDWALIAPMPKSAREAVVAAMIGGITLDAAQVRSAVARLGNIPADDPALIAHVEQALNRLVRPATAQAAFPSPAAHPVAPNLPFPLATLPHRALSPFPVPQLAGFDWLLGLLDQLALDGHIQVDPSLSLFRKTWLSLAGVLADLGGEVSPDLPLIQRGLAQLLAEWPRRTLAGPRDASALGTHVSNAQLAGALMSASLSGWQWAWRTGALFWSAASPPSDQASTPTPAAPPDIRTSP